MTQSLRCKPDAVHLIDLPKDHLLVILRRKAEWQGRE
jgi:hypothetical protein